MLGFEFESCGTVCVEVLNANSCCSHFSVKCINEPEGLGSRTKFIAQKVPWGVMRVIQSHFLDAVRLSRTDVWVALRSSPYFQRNEHMLLKNVLFEHHVLLHDTNPSLLDKASNHNTRMHFINLTPVQLAQQMRLDYIPDHIYIKGYIISLYREKLFLLKVHRLSSLKSWTQNPLKISGKPPGGFSEFCMRSWQKQFYVRISNNTSTSGIPLLGLAQNIWQPQSYGRSGLALFWHYVKVYLHKHRWDAPW